MAPIITDLKNDFRRASISQQFIYINCGIFVVTSLVTIVGVLFNVDKYPWMEWLELPTWLPQFI